MKPVQIYLFIYNAVQVVGWGFVLVKTANGLIHGKSYEQLYDAVKCELEIFQTAALLEIVHAALGFVRSPISTTVMQVFSRVMLVWPVLYKVESARSSIGVPMLLVCWSVTEVIRYSYYAFGIIGWTPYILTWMRYTFFIVLYPLGASGEVFAAWAALPEVAAKKHFTIEMPNAANISFSYYIFLIIFCFVYLPGFPKMYLHMFTQRKKVLGTNAAKKKE
uniref:Very-long-chain (3R)-3-hydroxyacyl-CoA dehydratase n=1 Tax=Plectus sambesii TaxID=2011161 RepID=A0A914ULM6_9BILA